ncbi:MAG TPA: heavy metal translocating P-type ATPase, partial [Campylobacterales bacterium]|nr:heavy metal translocating P-type ATPase [Campylobacterales bacterium]
MSVFVFEKLTLKHQTSKRVRLSFRSIYPELLGEIESYILAFDWAKSVRINHEACSIAIEYSKVKPSEIIDKLYDMKLNEIKIADPEAIFSQEKVLPLANPLLALAATPILPQNLAFIVSALASYQNILKGGSHLLKDGVSSEVLESLAIAISLYRKDYFAANTTNFLLELSEYIEDNIARKSDSMLESLLVPDIKEVWVERNGNEEKLAFELIKTGDIVIVNAGDTVAVDGTVISGDALVDESSMSGESVPIKKERGDRAISGTLVKEGRIRIWAEQVGEQSATYK